MNNHCWEKIDVGYSRNFSLFISVLMMTSTDALCWWASSRWMFSFSMLNCPQKRDWTNLNSFSTTSKEHDCVNIKECFYFLITLQMNKKRGTCECDYSQLSETNITLQQSTNHYNQFKAVIWEKLKGAQYPEHVKATMPDMISIKKT